MTYEYKLTIGEKNYSSWSMRAWLAVRHLRLNATIEYVPLYQTGARQAIQSMGGETGLVPVLTSGGLAVWDTLAIIELLAERHGGLWPEAESDRARARSYVCEVHSGLSALRSAMPVNTRGRNRRADMNRDIFADVMRVQELFERSSGTVDGWMFDAFGAVDIIFAPIATRFQTYGISLSQEAAAYQARLLAHPLVEDWLEMGRKETRQIDRFELPIKPN